jgi:hypothetical protein
VVAAAQATHQSESGFGFTEHPGGIPLPYPGRPDKVSVYCDAPINQWKITNLVKIIGGRSRFILFLQRKNHK